jgi:hypothetical protein
VWMQCVTYLHAQLTDDDPISASSFTKALLLIKVFLEWALQMARVRYGEQGHECLLMASLHEMGPELEHPLHTHACVFSARLHPVLYTSPSHAEPTPVSVRLQRRFHWWAYHETTGLESPHASPSFVYESQYSHLIAAMHALGHLGAMLKQEARAFDSQIDADTFKSHPMWETMYQAINDILFVVHAQLLLK